MSDIGSTMKFYHIKNLQSTKTEEKGNTMNKSFITLRIYKVLKQDCAIMKTKKVLSH